VNVEIKRFEKDLFSIDSIHYKTQLDSLRSKYRILFPFYFEQVGGWRISDSTKNWNDSILRFTEDPLSRSLYDSTIKQFPNLDSYQKQLETSLRYFKFYFPNTVIPEVNSIINGPPAFTVGDSLLCISLDKYLGPDFSLLREEDPKLPDYLLHTFRPEYLAVNSLHVLATNSFSFDETNKNLLDAMIYQGKIIYFLQQVLPGAPDSIVSGFSAQELKWLNDNESEIWKFFVRDNLIYSTDPQEYEKYVNPGPTTSGMPPEAPGNVGSWVGWRIISKYMKLNPGISLSQLMQVENGQQILDGSKYKPD
jgi:hypothetical protein